MMVAAADRHEVHHMATDLDCDECSGLGRDEDGESCRHCEGSGICDCPRCLVAYGERLVEASYAG
jgi:DnaJ-class molecular chaperone